MEVKCITGGPIDVNTYVVLNGDEALVIDPGVPYEDIQREIGGKKVAAVLLTHGHIDHILSLNRFQTDKVPVYIHKDEADSLGDVERNVSRYMGFPRIYAPADHLVEEGTVLDLAGLSIQVLHTPGHTPGSVCYLTDGTLFSGDTLFYSGYGRTDLPGGNPRQMGASLRRLYKLPKETVVYTGHGMKTSIGRETT